MQKTIRPIRSIQPIIILVLFLTALTVVLRADDVLVIAMCRPEESQIRNIRVMMSNGILPLKKIKLIGVYHEDERIDYDGAKEYAAANHLDWVSFEPIKGKVDTADLFKENTWTAQFQSIFKRTDGIIFTGGEDIPPAIYGEEQLLLTSATTPNRSYYELSFLFHLLGGGQNPEFVPLLAQNPKYPILGICLGAQTMNVAAGGSMVQDIPSQIYFLNTVQQVLALESDNIHSSRYQEALYPLEADLLPPVMHRIKLKADGFFITRLKMNPLHHPYTLSSHHQALKQPGRHIEVVATSMDGKVVEGIGHTKYENVLGVQFHPEYYYLFQDEIVFKKKPGDPLNLNLFKFLEQNEPSLEFHKAIWHWFADAMKKK